MASRYEYKFVSPPDDNLKCVICLEVALNPLQHEDCGKLFCSECILKYGNKPCPTCRKVNPRYFKDKRGEREIKDIAVRCVSVERGCQWTGTISTLEIHLPTCQFALVNCPNKCGKDDIMKKDLENHLKTKCPIRMFQCQHCGKKGTHSKIIEDHDKVCNKKIVPCPNKEQGCPSSMEQGKIKQHIWSVCDYTEVACTYKNLGCAVRMLRKDMEKHKREAREKHMDLALDTISSREEHHETLAEGEAFVFKLTGYSSKKEKREKLISESFYTHPGGYRMCVEVNPHGNGPGKGTHVSVYINVLHGQYNDQLRWPFLGNVTIELLNQIANEKHHSRVSVHGASEDMTVGSSRGFPCFIPHSSLSCDPTTKTQYLHDDTLFFRVSVAVANHKPWLVCTNRANIASIRALMDNTTIKDGEPMVFKVTGFYARKTTGGWIYSDSFYTSPGGYKMCILVCYNGNECGRGTHISVYAKLVEGAYDGSLSWPFIGSATISVLNQIQDKNHFTKKIEFGIKQNAFVGNNQGYDKFINFAALSQDPLKGIQYLKDDTLYFKVSVNVASHKPWLVCTHHE